MAEARDGPARSFMPKLLRGGRGSSEFGRWLRDNGSTVFVLTLLFLLALFIRSYFAFETSADNGYIVSGGSDSYYWRHIIEYNVETGLNLYWDPLLNYPWGQINPRPPMFSMAVAIPAVISEGLFGSADDSIGFFFVWSTAFWGALTVVPVYFLGRETFGRRAGLVASLLFAVIPAHVQRSVLSNADHDALILFLIVVVFFFLLKAIKTQEHRKWVGSWKSRSSIAAGLKDYFANSRTAVLYALMAGAAYAALMMTWVGFAYVTVIILVYYFVQLLVNTFRYQDSTSVTMLLIISMGFGYLMALPYYANYLESFFDDRFLVPVALTVGGLIFGLMFVVMRDLPWTISLPSIAVISAGIIVAVILLYPWLGEAIMAGQGYFSKSKLYSTIAEARAPQFSELALSFGMVTFFLSLAGLIYAMVRIPKRTGAEFIFIVVWLAASIFMAISAGRFMFNAAPAFAIAAAWVFVTIVDKLDFNAVRRSMAGASGSPLAIMRKSIKIRHVVGVLFLGFMVILPNVWFSIDAGIPSETKRDYDKEIYFSLPSVMRPGGYDKLNGSNWYLGAFGYSLPLPSYYYPAAWDWFSEQDSDVYPVSSRPAYVAWWDYGFEAVAEGEHPTVADNFQNGYQIAGNTIMAQSELDAVALFCYRIVQVGMDGSDAEEESILSLLETYGLDRERIKDIVEGEGQPLIDEVLSDPDIYGPMSSDLSVANARIVAGRTEVAGLGTDAAVALYGDLCALTGWEIRYFNVDSRMFPLSGYETGIFYAPAKLSDRRVDSSIPLDFFKIVAVDDRGVQYELDEVTADMRITDYQIAYLDMFYDSMFYRAMCGFSGADIGLENDGLPGAMGIVQKNPPMPGWNMTHFKMVYRTAYYNPYPSDQLAYHSRDWVAVSYDEALELRKKISAGELTGVVDDSASSLYRSGTVFLKYYHGAYVNGTIVTEQGFPAADMWVTVQDEYGIPHHLVKTDEDGRYSALAPFGNVTLIVSDGSVANTGLYGTNVVARIKFNVTDDQAMRVKQDLDGDGRFDYIITKDYVIRDSMISGDIFWDIDLEGNFTSGTDELIKNVTVYAVDTSSGETFVFEAPEGTYDGYLPAGQYGLFALVMGYNLTMERELNVTAGKAVELNQPVAPAMLRGYLLDPDGNPVSGSSIALKDIFTGVEFPTVTAENGGFVYDKMPPSKYIMITHDDGKTIYDERFSLSPYDQQRNVTLWDRCTVSYRATLNATPAAYAVWVVTDNYDPKSAVSGSADKFGMIRLELPPGQYTLQVVYSTSSGAYAGSVSLGLIESYEATGTVPLYQAHKVTGGLKGAGGQVLKNEPVTFISSSGARIQALSDSLGSFDALLPKGEYTVVITSTVGGGVYGGSLTVDGDRTGVIFRLSEGVKISGTLYKDADGDGDASPGEIGRFTGIEVLDPAGYVYKSKSSGTGKFELMFPKGVRVNVSLSDPAYSMFSVSYLYGGDLADTAIVAIADPVEVRGRVTCDGTGISGLTVTFTPSDPGAPTVSVVSGAGGAYSADLELSNYTVVIDQEASTVPGHWYQHDSELQVLPSRHAVGYDIGAVLRVPVSGSVLGAAQDIVLEFTGPESVILELGTTLSYSLFLEPGTYSVYGTGRIGSVPFADMDQADIHAFAGDYDIQLERAYDVSGTIRVDGAIVSMPVTVTAMSTEGIQAVNVSTRFGQYSLTLPPGVYALSFLLEDAEAMGDTTAFVERWYEMILPLGSEDYSFDPSLLTRLDNTTVSGTVTDESGNPMTAKVEFIPEGKYGMYASAVATSSGAYSCQLQPGEYTVYVTRSVDTRVSLSHIAVIRNVVSEHDVQLLPGRYLQGRVFVSSVPAAEEVAVTGGDTRLTTMSSADGYFQLVLPSGEYTVSCSVTRVEAGVSISYARSEDVTVGQTSVYLDFDLLRNTKRTLRAIWDDSLAMTASVGQTVSYVVKVENTGNIADTYTLSYSGTDFELAFEPEQLSVDFGSNGNTAYTIVRITVGDTAPSGNNTVTVSLRSANQTSARTDVKLMVKVPVSRSVAVEGLNVSDAVSSTVTTTRFLLNNTGNAEDDFAVSVANTGALNTSGWSARVIDPETGDEVINVTLAAFASKELSVEFTSTRSVPDPRAEAVVLAQSLVDGLASSYGQVPVQLPDVSIGPGDIDVVRDDVSLEYDASRIYIDIALVVALVALVAVFFIMRKRKGLSGGGKK